MSHPTVQLSEEIPEAARTRLLWINASVFGIVVGLLFGVGLFLLTNVLVLKGGPVVGPHLALIGQVFVGYRVTFVGSLIGFAYAAVVGFALGYVGARLYNSIAGFRERWTVKHDGKKGG